VTHYPNIVIRASAGSGKTFRLSNRYLGLLRRGVSPDEILATTFTRKAAGEILDRVVVRVARAALDEDARAELARHIESPSLAQSDCLAMLRQLLRHLHRLRICTLDAFFAQLASSFSLELGLPPGWRIIESVQDGRLRREAIATTLRGDARREIDRLLQLMAKGEARRSISQLVQSTVDSLYGLYLETEPLAWRQIPRPTLLNDQQLEAAIDALRQAPLPDTSQAAKARDTDAARAQQSDWAVFIGNGMAKKVLNGEHAYYRKELPGELVDAYQVLLDHARGALLHQVANQTEATHQLLEKFHEAYAQLKHEARAMRFDDITRSLARQLSMPDIAQQHFRLDTTIDHLLLDEFQDTSLAQWHVLRPFALDVNGARTHDQRWSRKKKPSFFCVGDVKQAIYGWRGGLSEIFDALQNELPGLIDESMNVSYRSSQPVIDTVNLAFSRMSRHDNLGNLEAGITAWCGAFEPHETARQSLAGYAELSTVPAAEGSEQKKAAKASYVARRIGQLVEQAPGYEVGVLVRSNEAVARMIFELRQQGIPASEEGGNPLTDSPAVQVLLSLLKIADHPGDTVARYHVATSPLAEPLELGDHNRLDRALAVSQRVRSQLLHDGYGPSVLEWAGLLEPHCDQRDRNRLRQFVALAYAYQEIATLRTSDFQAYVESERVADPTTAAVRVMTVHQAKGLQFDIVVLPDLDVSLTGQADNCVVGQPSPTEPVDRVCLYRNADIQKLLPAKLQELFETSARRGAQEAMCLLYVALTRAVHALYMFIDPTTAKKNTLHKTPAGLLRAGLTDGQALEPETLAYHGGAPRWFEQEQPREAAVVATSQLPEPVPVSFAPMRASSRLEPTAPSQLEGGARVSAARTLDLRTHVATSRGTLIHALFEQINWLDDGVPEHKELRQIAERLNVAGLDPDEQLEAFHRMLAMPEIARVLERRFYESPAENQLAAAALAELAGKPPRLVVHNERRFAVRDEGCLLSGIIDRLVLLYDQQRLVGADVLDYKTDTIDDSKQGAVDERVEYYRPQLEAYCRAVTTMFRLPAERISARLLFVSAGIVPRLM